MTRSSLDIGKSAERPLAAALPSIDRIHRRRAANHRLRRVNASNLIVSGKSNCSREASKPCASTPVRHHQRRVSGKTRDQYLRPVLPNPCHHSLPALRVAAGAGTSRHGLGARKRTKTVRTRPNTSAPPTRPVAEGAEAREERRLR